MGEYQELRQLTPRGIRSEPQPLVMTTLAALGCEAAEPSRSLDLDLLDASQAMLCMVGCWPPTRSTRLSTASSWR